MAWDLWQAFQSGQQMVLNKQQEASKQATQDALVGIQNRQLDDQEANTKFDQGMKDKTFNQTADYNKWQMDTTTAQNKLKMATPEFIASINKIGGNLDTTVPHSLDEVNAYDTAWKNKMQNDVNKSQIAVNGANVGMLNAQRKALIEQMNTNTAIKQDMFNKIKQMGSFIEDVSKIGAKSQTQLDQEMKGFSVSHALTSWMIPDKLNSPDILNRMNASNTITLAQKIDDLLNGKLKDQYPALDSRTATNDPQFANMLANYSTSFNYLNENASRFQLKGANKELLDRVTAKIQSMMKPAGTPQP